MMMQKLILAAVVALGVAACSSTGNSTDSMTAANGGGMAPKGAVETGDSGTTASGNATAGAAGTATTTNSMGTSSSGTTTTSPAQPTTDKK